VVAAVSRLSMHEAVDIAKAAVVALKDKGKIVVPG